MKKPCNCNESYLSCFYRKSRMRVSTFPLANVADTSRVQNILTKSDSYEDLCDRPTGRSSGFCDRSTFGKPGPVS